MDTRFIILWCIICTTLSNAQSLSGYRLNEDVLPSKYKVEISMPDFPSDIRFLGKVAIELSLPNDRRVIRMHKSNEMNITSIEFDGESVSTNIKYNASTEIMEINLDGINFKATGVHDLKISYESILYNDMHGFYISTYNNKNGDLETIGTTQFQPTHARRAFPCFDEPFFKAKFSISITHPNVYTATGNQPILAQRKIGRLATTIFQETEKMSTYLVAFVVHKFAYKIASDQPDKPMKVWSPEEVIDTADFAAAISMNVVEAMERFTGVDYWRFNMKHLDQFAIPDFSAGAMENWGLVTYRETALLWKGGEKEKNRKNQQRVASVIAHEFAHMWFGNILTLNWWNTTWLNEGFARYFEYHIVDKIMNGDEYTFDWEMHKQFVVEQQHAIFQKDAVEAALSLTHEVFTKDEISAMFGSITYNKGACVIRMMQHFLGDDKFQHGLHTYLENNLLSSSTPNILFTHMQQEDESIDLAKVMKSWTEQSGYPVVTVKLVDGKLQFSQRTFSYDKTYAEKQWQIPISYVKEGQTVDFDDTKPKLWLLSTTATEDADISTEWVIVNVKQTGYYRVNYDEELWSRISSVLQKNHLIIDEINRAQIVDDLFNLARIGDLSYNNVFDITSYLKNEESYYSWYAAFGAFSYLRRRLPEGELKEKISDHLDELMEKVYNTVSFDVSDDEKQIEMHKKVLVLQWACELNKESCYKEAIALFDEFMEAKENKVDSNVRSIVYCAALRHAESQNSWEYLFDEFKSTTSAADQVTIMTSLGCTRDVQLLNKYLQMSVTSGSDIRPQDANSVFNAVLTGNPEGVEVALDFLIKHPKEIIEHYGSMNAISTVILNVAERIKTQEHLDKFENFLDDNLEILGDAREVAEAAANTARANLHWIDEYQEQLEEYFESH